MRNWKIDGAAASVLLIDGECALCSGITRFVVKRDKPGRFRFASLQSGAGRKLLTEARLPVDDFQTFVLIENSRIYTKSEAALRVLRRLNGLWPLLYLLIWIPAGIRDRVYDWIARRRYRLFGKADICLLLSAEVRERFLIDGVYAARREGAGDEQ
ncbi:thiol-disulfide oxidoreductase DCC family protein [Paenibacillus arenilitoris]|uniref:DUF393 domain-containing protein n=1 Tax=Paenibacillus arenilitoris TaxID=2772299 RepID=A0A927CPW1_9BACL|nr:DCC1-like thiol-disulfide oxidoreductase family protein [Paenibacillus arenilitoris]MBD2869756.1 DUF393 domain-containing protein [Paenibacillus arenilitoris]